MASISAASLVDAMLRLRPDAAPTLAGLTERICNGTLDDPVAFSEAVRYELGGTILLDALLLLHGAPMTKNASEGDAELRACLFRHCVTCTGACSIPGCLQMPHRCLTDALVCVCEPPLSCGDTLSTFCQ